MTSKVFPGQPNRPIIQTLDPVAPNKLGSTDRLLFLDAIRGLAALAVVLQHILWYVSPSFENFFSTIWSPGRFGVVAFFIVSGFIVPHSLEAKKEIKGFWLSRFFRLFPAYWASLLLIALIQISGIAWHEDYSLKYLVQWAVNITMLHGFLRIQDINPVAWTLSIELGLYLAITVAYWRGFLKKTEVISGTLLALVAVPSVLLPALFHLRFPAGAAAVASSIVIGLVLFRYFSGDLKLARTVFIVVASFVVLILSSIYNYSPLRLASAPLQPTQFCATFSALSGGAFFLIMMWRRAIKFPKLILWLGKVSYSLYLFHPVAGMVVPKSIGPWERAFIVFVFSILLAWLGYTWIEAPAMKYASALRKRKLKATEVNISHA